MRSPISIVDVDRPDTWTRYRAGLCVQAVNVDDGDGGPHGGMGRSPTWDVDFDG